MNSTSPYGSPGHSPWQRPGGQAPAPAPTGSRPSGPWRPPGADRAPQRGNTPGLIALAAAVLGTVLACLPVVRPLGWALLPGAFVLALVALSGTGKKIGAALTALFVAMAGTGVATVVGIVAVDNGFTTGLRDGFVRGAAVGSGVSAGGGTDRLPGGPATAPDRSGSAAPTSGPGSRAEPIPLGEAVESGDWEIVIESVDLDADERIAEANPFNEPPEPGTRYAVVSVTGTYRGEGSARLINIRTAFVTDSGNVINSTGSAVPPRPHFLGKEVYGGGTATGNEVLQIPADEQGLLRVSGGHGMPEFFMATS